jgi:hypothetical protein
MTPSPWVADRLRWRVHAKVQAEVHAEHGFAMTLRHDGIRDDNG